MAMDSIKGYCSMDLGVDLGTCTTIITVGGKGIVLEEPSVVAINRMTNKVLNNGNAVGSVAREMLGKTPQSITTIRPLRNGVISDFEATEAMLSYFIKKVSGRKTFKLFKPRVVVAVPSCITDVERRAVIESVERTGASHVYLLDEPMAAGIGSGLPVANPTASMIVDIGGGTTDVAIISLADIASCQSVRVGGDAMDRAIGTVRSPSISRKHTAF
jgi:rod shape-determining protein MreB